MKHKRMMRDYISWYYLYDDCKYIIATETAKEDRTPLSYKYTAISGTNSLICALLYTIFHKNEVVIIKNL